MDLLGLEGIEDYLGALRRSLQLLAVFSALTFLAVVALGSVIVWQLSGMARRADQDRQRTSPTPPPPYPGNYGQPPQPPYRP